MVTFTRAGFRVDDVAACEPKHHLLEAGEVDRVHEVNVLDKSEPIEHSKVVVKLCYSFVE